MEESNGKSKNVILKIVVVVLSIVVVGFVLLIFVLPSYNQNLIQNYQTYLYANGLVVTAQLNELNQTVLLETPFQDVLIQWVNKPESQLLVVNEWMKTPDNVRSMQELICEV